ncbi:DUF748 domain-containing protein [Halomonas sp. GXIMD04776]|uniref:DUF748 domain-containing protein n=1 Tax=Halomonas sp. GXIMD04776 TaxID=3415605 RepID=UPI003CB50419
MVSIHQKASRRGQPSRKRWWLVPLGLAILAGLLVVAWLWALPYYIEQRLVSTFSSITGREVSMKHVAVNPFTATLTLEDFRIAGQDQIPVLSSDKVMADVQWRSLWSPGWRLAQLDLQSPRLQLIWRENGDWNLVEMLASDDKNKSKDKKPTPILIERITAGGGRFDWINRRIDKPVTLSFEQVSLDAEDYDNTSDAPFTLQSQSRLAGAALSAKGKMGFAPWKLDVDLTADELPLATLSDYLSKVVRARVNSGMLTTQARMQAGEATDAGLRITGQSELHEIEMLEPDGDQPIARAERMNIDEFLFELDRPRLEAGRMTLQQPWAEVIINERMGTNLTAWLPPKEQSTSKKSTGSNGKQQSPSMRYALDDLVVKEGTMTFADRHLPEPFKIDFSALEGKWKGLSSSQQGGGELSLEGQVSDGAPLSIEGRYDPLSDPWQGNLDIHVERMRLTTFAPYLRRFAGYEIERGEVSLGLDYRLEDGRLNTNNQLVLRRIRLGEQVDPTATELPVKTLIGVLRNDDGTIELEIPMTIPLDKSGSIEFGDIAGQAIRKALQNLISSPIETLGEVVQGGSDNDNDSDNSGSADDGGNENVSNDNGGSEGGNRNEGESSSGNDGASNEPQEDSQSLYRRLQTPN